MGTPAARLIRNPNGMDASRMPSPGPYGRGLADVPDVNFGSLRSYKQFSQSIGKPLKRGSTTFAFMRKSRRNITRVAKGQSCGQMLHITVERSYCCPWFSEGLYRRHVPFLEEVDA